jgi:hypothetical protein
LKFKSNNYYEIGEIEMKKKNDELKLRIERKVEVRTNLKLLIGDREWRMIDQEREK